jgi:hypothetical protein
MDGFPSELCKFLLEIDGRHALGDGDRISFSHVLRDPELLPGVILILFQTPTHPERACTVHQDTTMHHLRRHRGGDDRCWYTHVDSTECPDHSSVFRLVWTNQEVGERHLEFIPATERSWMAMFDRPHSSLDIDTPTDDNLLHNTSLLHIICSIGPRSTGKL